MPYIVITTYTPYNNVAKVGEKWDEVVKGKRIDGVLSVKTLIGAHKKGYKSVLLHEIEQGKLEDAMGGILANVLQFTTIEGFTYEMEIMASQGEALQIQQESA